MKIKLPYSHVIPAHEVQFGDCIDLQGDFCMRIDIYTKDDVTFASLKNGMLHRVSINFRVKVVSTEVTIGGSNGP